MHKRSSYIGMLLLFACFAGVCLFAEGAGGDKKKKKGKKKNPPVESITVFGKPAEFGKGKAAMYAIWFENGLWHLRVTTKKKGSDLFTGTVRTNQGKIIGKWGDLEKGKDSASADYVITHVDGGGFDFRFANFGGTDTVNFAAGPEATELLFDILIDGGRFPNRVLVGKSGQHPSVVPFTLPAHPK